jgi:hypothetical protein
MMICGGGGSHEMWRVKAGKAFRRNGGGWVGYVKVMGSG